MRRTFLNKQLVAGCGLAVALSAGACADSGDNMNGQAVDPAHEAAADTTSAQGTSGAGHEGAVMTLTGCLQKQDGIGDSFILTQVNAPSGAVGTSGADAGVAEREQMRAAKHSYELAADDDDSLEKLVGKQVRVTGRLEEVSDLNRNPAGSGQDSARSRAGETNDRRDINAGDLAKLEVQTVTQVADSCSNAR